MPPTEIVKSGTPEVRAPELPPVVAGHESPVVVRKVESFYHSVAAMFEAWVARSAIPTERTSLGWAHKGVSCKKSCCPRVTPERLTTPTERRPTGEMERVGRFRPPNGGLRHVRYLWAK